LSSDHPGAPGCHVEIDIVPFAVLYISSVR
jgi:hypothetical protein